MERAAGSSKGASAAKAGKTYPGAGSSEEVQPKDSKAAVDTKGST